MSKFEKEEKKGGEPVWKHGRASERRIKPKRKKIKHGPALKIQCEQKTRGKYLIEFEPFFPSAFYFGKNGSRLTAMNERKKGRKLQKLKTGGKLRRKKEKKRERESLNILDTKRKTSTRRQLITSISL